MVICHYSTNIRIESNFISRCQIYNQCKTIFVNVKLMTEEDITAKILEFSQKLGIDVIGFADPNLFNNFPEKNRPDYYLKKAKSIIIIGVHLYDIILDAWSENQGSGKSFHFLDSILENYCNHIKHFLEQFNYQAEIITYTPGIYLKDAAALAGIGPIGKNNLIITSEFGSQVRLRAIATTAPLKNGEPITESHYCKECNLCINSCPAGAINEQGYSKSRCLLFNLSNLKKLSKYTSIWCNVCIEVCPISKKAISSNIEGSFKDSE